MFVTSSNLDTPPYNLPNLDKVANTFSNYVDAVEEEALVKLLGRQLYDSFIEGLPDNVYDATVATVIGQQYEYGNDIWEALTVTTGTTPVEGVAWHLISEDDKWLELKNGVNYDYASKTWKWKGLVFLLTPLVASRWIRDNVDSFTGSAVVVASNENSTLISPALRICRAHNDYAERVGVMRGVSRSSLHYANRSYHFADCMSYQDTLYGFLVAAGDTVYEGWTFEAPDLMNIAGI